MKILAINTASLEAQIALLCGEKKVFKTLDASMKHSENLLPEIEKILFESNLTLNDLDAVMVNVGPGSFTGLRISIATIKAFLNVFEKLKCIKTTTFELIANEFYKSNCGKTNVVIDALSNLYYLQQFDDGEKTNEPKLISLEEMKTLNKIVSNSEIENENKSVVNITCENLLNVAIEKFEKNEFISEEELLPLYIRPSQAEANRK